jgi:hypothetical protein
MAGGYDLSKDWFQDRPEEALKRNLGDLDKLVSQGKIVKLRDMSGRTINTGHLLRDESDGLPVYSLDVMKANIEIDPTFVAGVNVKAGQIFYKEQGD